MSCSQRRESARNEWTALRNGTDPPEIVIGHEAIPHTPDRDDASSPFDLRESGAEATNLHVETLRIAGSPAPQLRKQLPTTHHHAGVAHEQFGDVELSAGKLDQRAVDRQVTTRAIELDRPDSHHLIDEVDRHVLTSNHGAHPRDELS